ncbi:MAG: helix-turn-helix transcriptional regulator [Atopobiaceae bacterium]|nr:helix-turn-helix transcriptional regulator [Atopobiaceae bacterium]
MEYGKALRSILRELDVSQAELARRMNTSTAYVSQLCSGKIKEPSLSKAYEIADVLGVSVDRFVELMRSEG